MPSTAGKALKVFRVRYALEGTPYATAVEVKAVSIDAAYEAAEEMYPNWEIEAVIQVG